MVAGLRVVGTDPGTSSLDLLLMVDGLVADQARLEPEALRAAPGLLVDTLRGWQPLDLVLGPSGYGVPLTEAQEVGDAEVDDMALMRPEERGRDAGVVGLRRWVRELTASGIPVWFGPGVIHLPTVPSSRKLNRVDMGTADKLAVAALAILAEREGLGIEIRDCRFALVEVGSAFTTVLVLDGGAIVDASAGTAGPVGLRCGGAWDGEAAYWLGPLGKQDLFHGGVGDMGSAGLEAFGESLRKHVAGLRAVTAFDRIWLSGAGIERADVAYEVHRSLAGLGVAARLPGLAGAWVKHAAQGSAVLADGLAGGRYNVVVESLALRQASGTIRDYLWPLERGRTRT